MTQAQIHYCQTVEKVTLGDEDAKDDLWYDAQKVIAEDPEKFKGCITFLDLYNKLRRKYYEYKS